MFLSQSTVVLVGLVYLCGCCKAQDGPTAWSAQPINPPALPIAVRSPYMNTWLKQGNNPLPLSNSWPVFWTTQVTAWYSSIRVDGTTYQVSGAANVTQTGTTLATQKASVYTPTRTSFLLQAGPVDVNLTFLSPIEPTNLVRQSMPFTYVHMDVTSSDSESHNVQVYSDISAEWVSGDRSMICNWTHINDDTAFILQTQLATPQPFTEITAQAQDAVAYMSMLVESGVTWRIDADALTRSGFSATGRLTNNGSTTFGAIDDAFPVFAISKDLGNITATDSPVVWGLGLVRDPVVQYKDVDGNIQFRHSYFWSNFTQIEDVVKAFLNDFDRASNAAIQFDTELLKNASSISSQYADLVSLSTRQILASLDITISQDGSGNWNTSDVLIFMKGFDPINEFGNVNPVDVIFSSFSAFLTLNPDFCKYLLEPLLRIQTDPNSLYALHDLGSHYPNAIQDDATMADSANLSVEDNASMIIMVLAHAQTTGDRSLIMSYYAVLKRWAESLVDNSLAPDTQITADKVNVANQTSIAVKGIIGVGAMSGISQVQGNSADASRYANISQSLVTQWQSLATAPDQTHILANYGALPTSFALMYNFFADRLLQLSLIPEEVYDMQTSFYASWFEGLTFGTAYNSLQPNARTDYTMLTAATVNDSSTRDALILSVHNYASSNLNNTPFCVEFTPDTGTMAAMANVGQNNPAQGAMFSFLALNVPIQRFSSITSPDNSTAAPSAPSSPSNTSSSDTGIIAGSIIGGFVALTALSLTLFWYRRHHRGPSAGYGSESKSVITVGSPDIRARPVSGPLLFQSYGDNFEMPASSVAQAGTSAVPAGTDVQWDLSTVNSSNVHPYTQSSPTDDSPMGTVAPSDIVPSDSISVAGQNPPPRVRRGSRLPQGSLSQTSDSTATSSILAAKQQLLNDELRREVENLRREMEVFREEREFHPLSAGAPPSYS